MEECPVKKYHLKYISVNQMVNPLISFYILYEYKLSVKHIHNNYQTASWKVLLITSFFCSSVSLLKTTA